MFNRTQIRVWFYNLSFGWVYLDNFDNWVETQKAEDTILSAYPACRVSWYSQSAGCWYYRTSAKAGFDIGDNRNFNDKDGRSPYDR